MRDDPLALCTSAGLARSRGEAAQAEALYQRALAADPSCYSARYGLPNVYLDAGDAQAAAPLVQQLLVEHGGQPEVLWLASRLHMARRDHVAAEATLAALLAVPVLSAEQRAEALLSRGVTLDALDRPNEAFAAAVAGKALQRKVYATHAAGLEGEVAKLSRLADWFAAASAADWAPLPAPPSAAAGHAFILGFPRSGTTLLEQALAGHPDVVALEEAPTLATHYAAFLADDTGCARLAELSGPEADAWRAHYWDEVKRQGVDVTGRTFIDKAPAGTLSLPLIAKLFPEATVFFAVRDPRDVVLSCLRHAFRMNAMTFAFTTLAETAACYDAGMRMAANYRSVLPVTIADVRHETLVEDFDGELARVAGLLGLDVHPAMRDIAATARARKVRTPSAPQLRGGLSRSGLGRWRAYASQLDPVLPVLQPWVERFGYAA